MKIDGHIIEVSTNGGDLFVKLQGVERSAPEGAWLKPITFIVRETPQACRTFYLGRELTITVAPRGHR